MSMARFKKHVPGFLKNRATRYLAARAARLKLQMDRAPVINEWELARYGKELQRVALRERIDRAQEEFYREASATVARGRRASFGGPDPEAAVVWYGIIRKYRPRVLVETGVCNGVSTAYLLQALAENGEGHLYSIDLPEYTDVVYEDGTFWEGKAGAAVPKGKEPGWVVPDPLRERWSLTLGKSQDELPPLLERLGTIDFFLHDSEHSYACMSFEYQQAYAHLRDGGILASDDISWNKAFSDFAAHNHLRLTRLYGNGAMVEVGRAPGLLW